MKPFIIRYAGGVWWVIRRRQDETYRPPLVVNETAAEILRILQDGSSAAETARKVSEDSGVSAEEIEQDIRDLAGHISEHFGIAADEFCTME